MSTLLQERTPRACHRCPGESLGRYGTGRHRLARRRAATSGSQEAPAS